MGIDKNLVQGSMALLLLRLLETKDMYGYEMIEALRSKSNNVFELKAGTLYPLLHSLESKGYVRSYEDASSGKKRRYYCGRATVWQCCLVLLPAESFSLSCSTMY